VSDDISLLDWEPNSKGDMIAWVPELGDVAMIFPASVGGFAVGIWTLTGHHHQDAELLKEYVQAWVDLNRHQFRHLPMPKV